MALLSPIVAGEAGMVWPNESPLASCSAGPAPALVFSLGAASCERRSDNNSPGLKAQTGAWVAARPANEGRLGKLLTELFKEGEGPLVISQQPMESMQMKMDPLAGPWELLH